MSVRECDHLLGRRPSRAPARPTCRRFGPAPRRQRGDSEPTAIRSSSIKPGAICRRQRPVDVDRGLADSLVGSPKKSGPSTGGGMSMPGERPDGSCGAGGTTDRCGQPCAVLQASRLFRRAAASHSIAAVARPVGDRRAARPRSFGIEVVRISLSPPRFCSPWIFDFDVPCRLTR